jgi:hypothetical protein
MKPKRSISLNSLALAIIALMFSLGSQHALAANLCGSGLDCGFYNDYGIHYPFFHPFFEHLFPYFGCYHNCYGYQLPFP